MKSKYDEYGKEESDEWGPCDILKSEGDSRLSEKLIFTLMAFKKWIWMSRGKKKKKSSVLKGRKTEWKKTPHNGWWWWKRLMWLL